ncbi:MAG: hypothetical protein JW819_02080 [Candidatus Krumholzibacteriota bacterium]|nr:hypothetical protein [Candidatus Krumholzibacteriota bacterium]
MRGLCCRVTAGARRVVIDPGLALGYQRHGLLPHPAQVAVGERVRRAILAALAEATDVVVSHFHGDHMPLADANPFQLELAPAADACRRARCWVKGPVGAPPKMQERRHALAEALGRELPAAEGKDDGPLAFSPAFSHGDPRARQGMVMMTRVADGGAVFVHASDTQLLDNDAVAWILAQRPQVVLADGPPLYLSRFTAAHRRAAWENALRLSRGVATLVLDHHLMRSDEGMSWLERLASETGHAVLCAADFMGRPRRLLESHRRRLYAEMPVPAGWHEDYARGAADTRGYRTFVESCGDERADT